MLTIQEFLNDEESLIEIMEAFDKFSSLFSLKLNKFRCETTGIEL